MPFQHRFLSVLAPFWKAKMTPKSIRNRSKLNFQAFLFPHRFSHRFFIDFSSQLRPPEPEKSSPRCSESTIFQKIAFRNWHRFLIDLGANLPPFSFPKSTKILSKIDFKRHLFFDRFLHRFFLDLCSIWEANLEPCWPHFPPKWGDGNWLPPLFCWVYVVFRFLGHPGPLLAPSWNPSWSHVGHIFLQNGVPCGAPPPFLLGLCYFSLFGSSWPPLGPIWARFWEGLGFHCGGFWAPF